MFLKSLLCCVGPFLGGVTVLRTYLLIEGGHANADTLQIKGEGSQKGPKTAHILKERPPICGVIGLITRIFNTS